MIYNYDTKRVRLKLTTLGHFLPFYPLKTQKSWILGKWKKCWIFILYTCTKNHDNMMYASWDMKCLRNFFLSIWAIFCPFTPLMTGKVNFEKMKKTPKNIFILHMCTINYNHMMYGSWDIEWAIFSPFTPITTQKIKIFKKWKNHMELLPFYTGVP